MNLDITFCSNKNCKNMKCDRNQKHLKELDYKVNHIWCGNFTDCEYWEEYRINE